MAKDETEWTLQKLGEAYMAATGCSEDETADVLARICAWHEIKPAVLPRLIALHAREAGVLPIRVLVCMDVLAQLMRTQNGNEFCFALGMLAAKRCGVARDVLEKLRALVGGPASGERGH